MGYWHQKAMLLQVCVERAHERERERERVRVRVRVKRERGREAIERQGGIYTYGEMDEQRRGDE